MPRLDRYEAFTPDQEAAWALYRRYQLARLSLYQRCKYGLKHPMPIWDRITKETTFQWRCETLGENVRWIIANMPPPDGFKRGRAIMAHVGNAFGVSFHELKSPIRDVAISTPRMYAIAFARREGVAWVVLARMLLKDVDTLKYAVSQVEHKIKEYEDGKQDSYDFRLAYNKSHFRAISARVFAATTRDPTQAQLRRSRYTRRLDRGKGQTSSDVGQPHC